MATISSSQPVGTNQQAVHVTHDTSPASPRQYESYQGRQADNVRGSVNSEIPTYNAGGGGGAVKMTVLASSLSPLALCWVWFGVVSSGGAIAMIVLAFIHSKSDYELALGLMIGGVFVLLMGVMIFIKGTVTWYRNYKDRTSNNQTNSPTAATPLLQ